MVATDVKEVIKDALIKPGEIKPGDFMQVVHFVKVRDNTMERPAFGRTAVRVLKVTDIDTGLDFEIQSDELAQRCLSADRFVDTVVLSRTDIVHIMEVCYNVPFKVCFTKQDGELREMRCRLVGPADFGRSQVIDIDVKEEHKLRLVDHRTVEWLIVRGTKYMVKPTSKKTK